MNMIHDLCIKYWIPEQSYKIQLVIIIEYALNDHFILVPQPTKNFQLLHAMLSQGRETESYLRRPALSK